MSRPRCPHWPSRTRDSVGDMSHEWFCTKPLVFGVGGVRCSGYSISPIINPKPTLQGEKSDKEKHEPGFRF